MQGEETDFDFQSDVLETPSLMTPNIVLNASSIKSAFNTASATLSNIKNMNSMSIPPLVLSVTTETTVSESTVDAKLSKIQDELKQSLNEARKPTPSPFQKISSTNIFNLDKPVSVFVNDDGAAIEIPSTADVVTELELLTNTNLSQFQSKVLMNDNNERESGFTLNGDNPRYDSSPTISLGPKKKLLMRSQSHTEPASPIQNNNNNNNHSQSQKVNNDNSILNIQNGIDEENSMDDSMNGSFTRASDLQLIVHSNDTNIDTNQQFKPIIDNGSEQHINIPIKTEQTMMPPHMIKQPNVLNPVNNINSAKRSFQPSSIGATIPTLTKANTLIIPPAVLNEVTSTDHLTSIKRQRTTPMPTNTTPMNFRPSFQSTTGATVTNSSPPNLATNGSNALAGSDDQRKKQIRDSNREAARRCRERRRQYIEQLEGNLEQYKAQVKQLSDKLARVERENTQLRTILSETKILHSGARIAVNEAHVDCTYPSVVIPTAIDMNSDSTHPLDGRTIQRNYIDRNNL